MLLILTNSLDATADYLVGVLKRQGMAHVRFDTDISLPDVELCYDQGVPLLRFAKTWYRPNDFSNVWYRRPERLKSQWCEAGPEGKFILDEWTEALEGFFAHIPKRKWMNHPSHNVLASHKIHQLSLAQSLGLSVPDTIVTHDASRLRDFFARHGGEVIAKPMARGYVERPSDQADTLIYTNRIYSEDLETLDDLRACPTLFQKYVVKLCDVRVTIVDSYLCAVALTAPDSDGEQRCDIRRNNMQDVAYRQIALPEEVEHKLRGLVTHYCLRFAAIDLAVAKDGIWYFLEVNPNGQWAWMDLTAGTNIASYFLRSFAGR